MVTEGVAGVVAKEVVKAVVAEAAAIAALARVALCIGVRCGTCAHVTLVDFGRVGSVLHMSGMSSHDCCSSATGYTRLKSRSGYAPELSDSFDMLYVDFIVVATE